MSEFMFKQDFVNIQITQLQIKSPFLITCVPVKAPNMQLLFKL